ncbi:Hit1p PWA37_003004 [Arxiozyma heterogenica]|uniref:HIT-type domain-containing protein n=1 Tax=Arxiozyma heterogenica TaxID=278026 RepID=A0AAN7WEP1_9SACH|nr:hypothetical protein RI543_004801 [Kazachstania heterogenica]
MMNNRNNKKLCMICNVKESNYKCPKCGVLYCSLICYKDEIKHVHNKETLTTKPTPEIDNPNKRLRNDTFRKIYEESPELQDLLRYNTVKFHLNKVYKIITASNNSDLNTENKNQLASHYLNTLRYGGIHYNEAIEEFCQVALSRLDDTQ